MQFWTAGFSFWLAGGNLLFVKQCLSLGFLKKNLHTVLLTYAAGAGGYLVGRSVGIGLFGDSSEYKNLRSNGLQYYLELKRFQD